FMPHAPSTTVFATLFLHDALPISPSWTAAPPTGTPPCKDLSGARAVLRSVRPRAALHPASAPRPHRGSTLPSPLRSGPAGGRRPWGPRPVRCPERCSDGDTGAGGHPPRGRRSAPPRLPAVPPPLEVPVPGPAPERRLRTPGVLTGAGERGGAPPGPVPPQAGRPA